MQLRSTVDHNKSMKEEVTTLKKDFKQKEDKYIEEFLDIKKLKEKVEDRLFKQDQSLQTVHMLCKSKPFYDEKKVITNHKPVVVHDSEETLEIAELTRKRMKGFRIYNKRTRRIMETIHVTFDKLHQTMAPVHISSGPEPMSMKPGQFSSGLIPNQVHATNNSVNAHVVPPGTFVSTTFAQDAPSTSFSPSSSGIQPPVIQHDVAV
ncbi:hypothetical protein Tco_1451637 [Tanacetum coccineum]